LRPVTSLTCVHYGCFSCIYESMSAITVPVSEVKFSPKIETVNDSVGVA
jgi:hypothetical protein